MKILTILGARPQLIKAGSVSREILKHKEIKENTTVPVIALSGAGKLEHIKEAFETAKVDVVACGSIFLYQAPLKGVLISYPSYQKIQGLLNN
jgi:imidazole glycerol-phosphate synthase subunit HisF